LWYLPIILLAAGLNWPRLRVALWIFSFIVMGIGCLANVRRCRRVHCYFTGPLFLLAALYVVLSAFSLLPMRPGMFLLIVLGLACCALCAEMMLGMYRGQT
jgi:hypothetical protein